MNNLTPSFLRRLLMAVCLMPVVWTTGAWGASIEWQAMQGRERVIITKAMTEGMTGNVTRVDANGIGIPFNQVPSGLVLAELPEEGSIVKATAQYGQMLAIVTQTPKFGFVVSRQTPTQIIIDFFPDELGARWKSDGTSVLDQNATAGPTATTASSSAGGTPTTPVAGEKTGKAVPQAVASVPVGNTSGGVTNPASETPSSSQASPTLPSAPQTPASGGNSAPTPIGWKAQPVQTNVPLLTSDGTKPVSAGDPLASPPPVVEVPAQSAPVAPLPEGVLLDTREDTAHRSAALPAPGLDVSLVQPTLVPSAAPSGANQGSPQNTAGQRPSQPSQQVAEGKTHPTPAPNGAGVAPRGSQIVTPAGGGVAEAKEQVLHLPHGQKNPIGSQAVNQVANPEVNQPANQSSQQAAQQASGLEEVDGTPLRQGVGLKVGPGSYRGLYNPVGIEGIATTDEPSVGQNTAGLSGVVQDNSAQDNSAQAPSAQGSPNQADGVTGEVAGSETSNEAGAEASSQSSVRLVVDDQNPAVTTPQGEAVVDPSVTDTPQGAETAHNQTEAQEQAGVTDALDAPTSLETDEDVIYVNEEGEEIIPPADPVKRLEEIRALIGEKKYEEANELVTALIGQTNLTKEQREDALHIRAEMLFFLYRDNLQQYAGSIIEATDLALNANSRSPKNAVALLRLGYVNLQLDNVPEAEARFNMLRRMFPNDENVPLSYYYWGDYFYNKGDLERAIDQFQVVTQKYPASKYAREASLGLARSFYRLGYYEQAFNIVEYIEQRWPRFYLNYPPFLNMMGDVAFRLNNFDFATRYYWLYANLDPNGEEVDVILTRIGDIYSLQQQSVAAKETYSEVVSRFPDTDGGLIALMRLAEESINDDPTIATMFNAFDSKPVMRPVDVYEKIINEHPQSKYVSLAQLKLAMWYLWNHDYTTTLDIADGFLRAKPEDDLAPKMKEVALKTFAVLSAESVANGSFSRMRDIWERYPMLKDQEEILTPESRVALGVSYWKDGRPDDALIAVEPFFLGNKIPEYSEMALSLVLQIYLQYDQWPAIEEVGRRVALWEIGDDNQMQLDYALAYARENMNKPEEAAVLWEKLYDSKKLPDDQMVYATYFLARDAEKRQRNDEAYLLGVEALKRLRGEAEKNPEYEDTGKIKSQISSLMSLTEEGGRLGESLEYAEQYLEYLPESDPDRAAVLFRMARINKKQGNEGLWRERMSDIVRLYPDSVYGQTADAALKSTDLEKAASAYSPQR